MTSSSAPNLGKEASGLRRADLSSMFAAAVPNRTEGVPRLAPPPSVAPPPTTAPAAPAPTVRPVRPVPPVRADASPAPKPRKKTSGKKHPSSVVVYLATSLRARLRAHAAATGRSHTLIVFDALNAGHERLGDLVASASPTTAEPVVDGLFVVQPTGHRVHDEDQVQVSIRPNPHNLAVIDALAEQHADGNRSALVAAALDAYLPPLA